MPTCTPIYQLPYPIGSDPLCDVDETLCELVTTVEEQLNRLDGIVDRTVDTVPLVRVRLTSPFTFVSTTNTTIAVPFDTIDVDTANMVNLEDDASRIMLPFEGTYSTAFQVTLASVPTGDLFSASIGPLSGFGPAFDQYLSDGSTPVMLNSSNLLRYTTSLLVPRDTTSTDIYLNLFALVGTFIVTEAIASVYWQGDLP